ncbi:hypothetical protein AVDCRST_MAG94-1664 [uncultured Leptolyngbya sp.]|uniref:Polymerase nucleotidyl transferase domain-containing protein n=1 Tax=uncultured Leptolyngbya sp. TaxID=332963 RepID=A0A6J4L772_9CYAN|nr:hypothetical protein AVDCRST_MAG94-1664 [uncultured Leptolyngbya sp.]
MDDKAQFWKVEAMTHPQLEAILAQLRCYLKQLYSDRLEQVILYGSQARGDARSDSDIDVLIVLREPVNPSQEIKRTSKFIAQLCLDNEVLISRAFASPAQVAAEQSPFFLNVRHEGVSV